MFSAINRVLLDEVNPTFNFHTHPELRKCYNTIDGYIRQLQAEEDPTIKQAKEIPLHVEEDLFCKGVLGDSSPETLLRTLLWLTAKYFGLRGGQELRDLRCNCFHFERIDETTERVIYRQPPKRSMEGSPGRRPRKQLVLRMT